MAYIFHEDDLPKLVAVVPGRERTFFVNKELTNIDDMLAGVMVYKAHGSSPYHYHEICEHFYFIMEGNGTVESEEGVRPVGPGDLVFIPAEAKHRLRATETGLFYFEFQAPNRFKTHILDGTPDDLRWNRVDGRCGSKHNLGNCHDNLTHLHRYQQAAAREDSARRSYRDPESAVSRREECFGTLRWLSPGEKFQAEPLEKHQLIYLMEGQGSIRLDNKDYDVLAAPGFISDLRNRPLFKPQPDRRSSCSI